MGYILQPDSSLFLLVNTQGSLNCINKVSISLIEPFTFYNYLWYMKQNLQLPVGIIFTLIF